jgi:hypothetical protein
LDRRLAYGDEVILLGRIVAVSVDREALKATDPYEVLQLFAFLESGTYGIVQHTCSAKVRHTM